MYKFAVLSVLVLGCTAVPYNYGGASYGGASYGTQSYLAPQKVALVGGYGSSSYGSGLALNSGYGNGGYSTFGSGLALNGGLVRSGQILGASGLAFGQSAGLSGLSFGQAAGANNFGLLAVRQQSQQIEPVVTAAVQQLGRTVEYRAVPNVEQPIQPQVIEVEPSDNPVHLHFKTRSSTLSVSQSHAPAPAQEVQTATAQDEPARLITEVQKPVIQEVREVISPFRQVTQEINPVQENLHTIVTKGEGQRAQYSGAVNYGAQYSGAQYGVANKFATVQAAPAIALQSSYVAPAVQSSYVAPAIQTAYVAKPAVASFQTGYIAKPAAASFQTSSFQSSYAKPVAIQSASFQVKPLKAESSYSVASSASADGY